MTPSDSQFNRQALYETSLSLTARMYESGLLSEEEFMEMKQHLIDEYKPIIQH